MFTPRSPSTDDARARVLQLVRTHGWNATAFQTLETHYSYYFSGTDACVAYVDTGRAWVAAGAPIASKDTIASVASDFVRAAAAAGRRACFAATEDRMRVATGAEFRALTIGEQPVWDPREWPAILDSHRSLREQLRRARAIGVTVRLLPTDELDAPEMRRQLSRVVDEWLSSRQMAPMGFLVEVEPFTFPAFRRCFVAESEGNVIAFAGVVPVPARSGWFIEDLVRGSGAPNGTAELLTDAVMRWAAAEGSDWLTLGLAPLAGDITGLLRAARTSTSLFYDFDGLRRYKAKLRPDSWSPIYLMYPRTQTGLRTIADMLVAFSRGGLLRFGMRTLLRGPTSVLRLLAVLLVPWTIVLSLAPVSRWFPSSQVRLAWVAFDVAMCAGLFAALKWPSRALVTALAVAITGDAALTLVQAIVWNAPRSRGVVDDLIIGVACLAPMVAAVVLWGARRARMRG
jgi:phosphatidylglycerol lysyltransferase